MEEEKKDYWIEQTYEDAAEAVSEDLKLLREVLFGKERSHKGIGADC